MSVRFIRFLYNYLPYLYNYYPYFYNDFPTANFSDVAKIVAFVARPVACDAGSCLNGVRHTEPSLAQLFGRQRKVPLAFQDGIDRRGPVTFPDLEGGIRGKYAKPIEFVIEITRSIMLGFPRAPQVGANGICASNGPSMVD